MIRKLKMLKLRIIKTHYRSLKEITLKLNYVSFHFPNTLGKVKSTTCE